MYMKWDSNFAKYQYHDSISIEAGISVEDVDIIVSS